METLGKERVTGYLAKWDITGFWLNIGLMFNLGCHQATVKRETDKLHSRRVYIYGCKNDKKYKFSVFHFM